MNDLQLLSEIEDLGIEINDVDFGRLLDWIASPHEVALMVQDPDVWYYPTKLGVIAQLAKEDNLPPRQLVAYKEWLSRTGWKDRHVTDSNGFLVWNGDASKG